MRYADGESLNLENVLFITCLEVNIPSLGKLDDQGCKTTLHGDLLTIFDQKGKKITKIKKSGKRLYHLKLNTETCLFPKEEEGTVWLWHQRFCIQILFQFKKCQNSVLLKVCLFLNRQRIHDIIVLLEYSQQRCFFLQISEPQVYWN